MTKPSTHSTRLRSIKATLACAAFGVTCLAVPAVAAGDAGAGEARSGDTRLIAESRGGDGDRERRGRSWRGKKGPDADELRDKMEARAERRFERMDSAGDGEVTVDEYVGAALDRHERMMERWEGRAERRAERREARAERREARAERRSARGDDEVRERRRHVRGHRRGARRAFAEFRDMSPAERRDHVRARAEERFERIDENGDGVVTFGEYWGAIEQRIERRAERKQRGTWRKRDR